MITRAITETLGYGEESVSVAIEDVKPANWRKSVYDPDITGKIDTLYKKPGYTP